LEHLKERRSEDEELITIIETNACSADAIQVLTGCTFGKGNFFHKNHGKHVYTFDLPPEHVPFVKLDSSLHWFPWEMISSPTYSGQ
jgi:formylmethanofuran dehydrogenase subunit E